MTNAIEELVDSDVIFVIGSNTTEQHPLVAMKIIEAVKKGATLIVADPRKIPLTHYGHIYAPLAPGSNLAFINGLLNVVVSEGLINEDFIKERTEGYEAFVDSIAEYTPEAVSKISGVPEEMIQEIARTFAGAKNASILFAMGITQHISGTKNVSALANLALMTGQVGRPSTGVNPLRGQGNVQGSCDMGALPDTFPGYQKMDQPGVREKFEAVWGKDFALDNGMTLGEMLIAAEAGTLKALYVIGENPMLTDPDLHHVKKVLESLEFLVVQDIFMTETAELADLVLPAASFIEKNGTFTNTERRVQRIRKAIEPIGNSMADWQILSRLISSFDGSPEYGSPADIMEEIRILVPQYGGISYERLEKGGLQWPCPSLDHPGTPYLHKGKFTRGLGKFSVNDYEPTTQKASDDYPFILTTGRMGHHYHSGTMTRRSWALDREHPKGYLEIHPKDAERLGITAKKRVKVSSVHGSVTCDVLITTKIIEGVVFIPFHFKEIPVNVLIGTQSDPVVQIPEFKVCAVKIEVI
jgi:predicted molibdopterin-dependent oxidoreductase YjgC